MLGEKFWKARLWRAHPENDHDPRNYKRFTNFRRKIRIFLKKSSAIIIACIAACGTIYGGYLQRKSFNLSVQESADRRLSERQASRPYLIFTYDFSYTNSDEGGIFIQNIGNGPAFIFTSEIIFKGAQYIPDRDGPFHEHIRHDAPWYVNPLLHGTAIGAGDRLLVIGLEKNDCKPEYRRFFESEILEKLQFKAEFGSPFLEKFRADGHFPRSYAPYNSLKQIGDTNESNSDYKTIENYFPVDKEAFRPAKGKQ